MKEVDYLSWKLLVETLREIFHETFAKFSLRVSDAAACSLRVFFQPVGVECPLIITPVNPSVQTTDLTAPCTAATLSSVQVTTFAVFMLVLAIGGVR